MEREAFSASVVDGPEGQIARCIVHGSKSINVVDDHAMQGMAAGISELIGATPDLRCIVLSGPTPRSFIGGANLNTLRALHQGSAESFIRSVHQLCHAIREARVPVIARMQGFCLGAGLEIAAACDIRVGDMSVECGMPEVKVGVPSVVEACLLPGLIGWGKARELMLRGNIIDAAESFKIGLLQHLAAADELDEVIDQIMIDICSAAPGAVAAQKRLFQRWEDESVSAAVESGVGAFVEAYTGDEPAVYINRFFDGKNAR